MAVRPILVPLDFSDDSHQALRWGASLAERYGASLLLLHVLPKAVEEVPKPASTAEWAPYAATPNCKPAPTPAASTGWSSTWPRRRTRACATWPPRIC